MKTIKRTFRKFGFDYTLKIRSGVAAIYEQKDEFDNIYYEVIKIRTYKHPKPKFNVFAGDEYYPSSEDWGTYGWTYKDYSLALKKFESVKNWRSTDCQPPNQTNPSRQLLKFNANIQPI